MSGISLADGIAEQLKCSICLEEYRKPKLLRCYHTYCQECIKQLLGSSEEANVVKCPQCRTKMKVPDGNVEALESNFLINNILEIMENDRQKKSYAEKSVICVECDLRGKNISTTTCETCNMPVCSSCLGKHNHKDELQNPDDTNSVPLCREHGEERTFYCYDCRQLYCAKCISKYHKNDKYVELKKALKSHKRVIDWLLVRCKVKKLNLDKEAKRVQVMDGMVAKNAHDTKLAIDEHFEKLSEALEKKRMELKADIDNLKNEKMKQILFQKEELAMEISSLASAIDFTEEAMKEGNEKELFSMRNNICNRLEELNDKKVEKCSEVWWKFYLHSPFDPDHQGFDAGLMSEFRVQNDLVKATVSLAGGEEGVLYNTFVNQSHWFVITLKDKDGIQVKIGGQDVRVLIRVPSRRDDELTAPSFSGQREHDETMSQYQEIEVEDNKDGTHSFQYKPKRQGDYYLRVSVNSKQVAGDLMWKVQGSLGFGDKAKALGCAVIQPPYGTASAWHHSVVGGKHSWKIKRVRHDEYEVVRIGVMMDFTSAKWGWSNGCKEEPETSPENNPSNIPKWEQGEELVLYSNEETGRFIIYHETSKKSDVFQRCPGTVARPYVYPAGYHSFSMDTRLERKLTRMHENKKKKT